MLTQTYHAWHLSYRITSNREVHNASWDLRDTIQRLRRLLADLEMATEGQLPFSVDVEINAWLIAARSAPCLVGQMSNHPSIEEGKIGATSEIFFIDPSKRLARTFNRWYRLGADVRTMGGRTQ